ncbi:hypothetical protein [Tatumella sp. OPLPL6]|uniref:hypothetical protein n=1 Tax=Tatumella sp. OPLPL6 TaxID=1928657 RepID=UPI000C1824E1|nr:hypothetical protein [Tatumella sp. OPLPL6]PIJ43331.1 hypothetical protein BOM24_09195 [Tatumella sp. OPLPL6]
MINEIDPFARADANGIIQLEGGAAWMARLEEWLHTPIGSVFGAPAWGSPLDEFRHEPTGSVENHVLEVAIESRVAKKLNEDMPGFALQAIRCESLSIDLLKISFVSAGGRYDAQLSLT